MKKLFDAIDDVMYSSGFASFIGMTAMTFISIIVLLLFIFVFREYSLIIFVLTPIIIFTVMVIKQYRRNK